MRDAAQAAAGDDIGVDNKRHGWLPPWGGGLWVPRHAGARVGVVKQNPNLQQLGSSCVPEGGLEPPRPLVGH